VWQNRIDQDGTLLDDTWVADITELLDLSEWTAKTPPATGRRPCRTQHPGQWNPAPPTRTPPVNASASRVRENRMYGSTGRGGWERTPTGATAPAQGVGPDFADPLLPAPDRPPTGPRPAQSLTLQSCH
jgi:hypothetical protein